MSREDVVDNGLVYALVACAGSRSLVDGNPPTPTRALSSDLRYAVSHSRVAMAEFAQYCKLD